LYLPADPQHPRDGHLISGERTYPER